MQISEWICRVQEHIPPSTYPRILEVGTGNGALLFALHDAGYDKSTTLLKGIDYSRGSILLSESIASSKNLNVGDIVFEERDFLAEEMIVTEWDLILDKGVVLLTHVCPNWYLIMVKALTMPLL